MFIKQITEKKKNAAEGQFILVPQLFSSTVFTQYLDIYNYISEQLLHQILSKNKCDLLMRR